MFGRTMVDCAVRTHRRLRWSTVQTRFTLVAHRKQRHFKKKLRKTPDHRVASRLTLHRINKQYSLVCDLVIVSTT